MVSESRGGTPSSRQATSTSTTPFVHAWRGTSEGGGGSTGAMRKAGCWHDGRTTGSIGAVTSRDEFSYSGHRSSCVRVRAPAKKTLRISISYGFRFLRFSHRGDRTHPRASASAVADCRYADARSAMAYADCRSSASASSSRVRSSAVRRERCGVHSTSHALPLVLSRNVQIAPVATRPMAEARGRFGHLSCVASAARTV